MAVMVDNPIPADVLGEIKAVVGLERARDIDFEALGDVPLIFPGNARGECMLHSVSPGSRIGSCKANHGDSGTTRF